MLVIIFNVFLLFAEGGEGGFAKFYDDYLNYPGFEAWKFLNLGIFITIMIYLLKKPLSEAFKAKRDAIRAELIKAEEEKRSALALLGEAESRLTQLESEKKAVMDKANDEAAAERKRLEEQTELETQRLREQADAEIARLTHQARAELRRFSAEESVRLAEDKVKSRIDSDADSRLVKASIQEMGGLN